MLVGAVAVVVLSRLCSCFYSYVPREKWLAAQSLLYIRPHRQNSQRRFGRVLASLIAHPPTLSHWPPLLHAQSTMCTRDPPSAQRGERKERNMVTNLQQAIDQLPPPAQLPFALWHSPCSVSETLDWTVCPPSWLTPSRKRRKKKK